MNKLTRLFFVVALHCGASYAQTVDLSIYLRGIAYAESSYGVYTNDPAGPKYGRGIYGISEAVLDDYIKTLPPYTAVSPTKLYEKDFASVVCLWNLKRNHALFGGSIEKMISAHNQGMVGTIRYGVAREYVKSVMFCATNNL
jgi:hypothetical protein